jgi:hypothetical protein
MAYRASTSSDPKQKSQTPIPGEPYCTNCKISGHNIKDCWSKRDGAAGKGPKQRERLRKKDKEKREKDQRNKDRDRGR